jgi:large subunit ribosomal protein L22
MSTEMETTYRARLRHAKIGPQKVRGIANLVRSKPVLDAQAALHVMPNRGASMLLKLLRSAVANAQQQNSNLREQDLFIESIMVDQGPPFLKKWRPRAHGRATPIKRLTSHITINLGSL